MLSRTRNVVAGLSLLAAAACGDKAPAKKVSLDKPAQAPVHGRTGISGLSLSELYYPNFSLDRSRLSDFPIDLEEIDSLLLGEVHDPCGICSASDSRNLDVRSRGESFF